MAEPAAAGILALTSLCIGCAAGYVMHRSDFCMAGMFRDVFLFRRFFMLRILAITVLATMALTELLRLSGCLPMFPYPNFGPPSATNLIGGMVFGTGMILAGGCVAGTLYKLGSGNIVSGMALIGLIIGSTLYAEFHELWRAFSAATQFAPGKITLAQLLDIQQWSAVAVMLAVLCASVVYWWKAGLLVRRSPAAGYLQPWKAALLLAALVALSTAIIGVPLGITTSFSKAGSGLEGLVIPRHLESLTYFSAQSFTFTSPLLGIAYRGGAGPQFDGVALIQYPLIAGLVAGGFISVLLLREFRIYRHVPVQQLLSGFSGGILMGLAARMAPSCNIWHLLGGLPILSLQSILFLIGLLPGAWLGGKLLSRMILNK